MRSSSIQTLTDTPHGSLHAPVTVLCLLQIMLHIRREQIKHRNLSEPKRSGRMNNGGMIWWLYGAGEIYRYESSVFRVRSFTCLSFNTRCIHSPAVDHSTGGEGAGSGLFGNKLVPMMPSFEKFFFFFLWAAYLSFADLDSIWCIYAVFCEAWIATDFISATLISLKRISILFTEGTRRFQMKQVTQKTRREIKK